MAAKLTKTENDTIIETAARAIQLRSQDVQRVWAPENWREIDLEYDGHMVVRMRPAADDATSVEVFRREDVLATEVLHGYDSATRLAELIEDVHRRAGGGV
jgi:hypothetical protein